MAKNINIDELAKEVQYEVASKFKEELPNIFHDLEKNGKDALGIIIGESFKLSMKYSQEYTTTLLKRVIEELD